MGVQLAAHPPCPSPLLAPLLARQIKPAVLRNFDKYAAVLLKPWYSGAEQEWTTGAALLWTRNARLPLVCVSRRAPRGCRRCHDCAASPPARPAEVQNLQGWLSKHLAWLDGEFAKQAGAAGPPPAGR